MTGPPPDATPAPRVSGTPDTPSASAAHAVVPSPPPLPPRDELARALARWIPQQRWSGARGQALAGTRIAAAIPVDFAPAARVLLVDADVAGARTRYLVAVAPPRAGEGAPSADAGTSGPPFADAVRDERFRLGLAHALGAGGAYEGDGVRLVARPEPGVAKAALAGVSSARLGSAEQSNTSIILDDTVILKLYRRVEHGEHPDVEVSRFLSRRGFAHTPRLLGVLELVDERGTSVAGMAQALVRGASDAWAHALADARAYVHGAAGTPPAYGDEAERLGAVTRAMHDTLASDGEDPAFAPRPGTRDDVARWASGARASVTSALTLLEARRVSGALDGLPSDARAVAEGLGARGDRMLATVDRLAAGVGGDAGAAVRHHGDYHLGQVIRGADDALYVIDFEGEPARPLESRRERHSALRDVAGMLRSFAYAAAMAALEDGTAAPDVRRARAAQWEADARARFLGAYFRRGATADAAGTVAAYLPTTRPHADALATLFEIEKLFYELAYELRNRPDWAPIPLAGIARVLGGTNEGR